MDMNIQKYMAFVKTVEYESFTKAAEILNYSQSGISRMIGDLEKEWNVDLLERGKFGVRLTSDGLKLMPYIKSVCEEYEKLHSQVEKLNGIESGLIRIGAFSSVATYWMPNVIKEFRQDYPNIEYEILLGSYTEIERWIVNGRVDLGFIIYPTIYSDIEVEFLAKDRLLAVLPKSHPMANMESFPIEKMVDYPFMLLEKGSKSEIAKLLSDYNVHPKIDFTTWDDYAIMSMVESGLGVSILPELILKRVPYDIEIKVLDVDAYREIGIAFKDKKKISNAVKKFLEYMKYR